jgi:PAS domain S-box-containing protein
MRSRDTSIRGRLMSILLSTSTAVVLVTSAVFCAYELLTFRQTTVNHLATVARVVAANSTAALAFDDRADAAEILSALRSEPDLEMAALYDAEGNLFTTYPPDIPTEVFPARPRSEGVRFAGSHLEGFLPVVQGQRQLGTLYLRSNLGVMYRRFTLYGSVVILVVISSLLVAYGLSRVLQRKISQPILTLAETARAVSDHRDYSVRAPVLGRDELGLLTEAFNHMLTQIQDRDQALREGAERMRAVLDSALSAVVIVDAHDRIIDWTARAEAVFGWSRREALGRRMTELLVPREHRPLYRRLLRRFLVTGQAPFFGRALETSMLRSDGTEFSAELSISPLKTGTRVTFCGFVTDITKRKHAEEEIRTLNQQLEHRVTERTAQLESANRELEAFSYSVSHDLRAPLRHIDGFAKMLQRHANGTLDAQGQRYLSTISDSARNMGRLIDDLLAFSRTGRAALTLVPVDQDALVAEVITEAKFDQKERAIEWRVEPLPQVHADPTLLRLVWRNLIGNAIKYSSRAPQPRIEIGRATPELAGEHVFFVRDNGVGFDMKYIGKLFGVFQRLHTQAEFEGTGIGLAHVKRIITRHGGQVWAEGKPGEGATFFFTLPVAPVADTGTVSPFG